MRSLILAAIAAVAVCAPAGAAEVFATVRSADGAPVTDAVVVALPGEAPRPRQGRSEIEQIDFEFVPRIKVVRVGTSVEFPNRDKARHHVYSFSPAKRFELPLYTGATPAPVLFDRPGVVVLGCNIHDWMIGYLYVSESPYFAQTGPDGIAHLSNLPAGSYRLQVWHPLMEATEESTRRPVALAATEASQQTWKVAVKPDVRVPRTRRAPK
jgi:plastocyanin